MLQHTHQRQSGLFHVQLGIELADLRQTDNQCDADWNRPPALES